MEFAPDTRYDLGALNFSSSQPDPDGMMSGKFVEKMTLGGSMDSERRHSLRWEPTRLVYAQLGEANGGIVINASMGGLCIQAVAPTPVSNLVDLKISPSGTETFGVSGKVVWTDDTGKLGGMEFVSPSPEIRARLKHWLASQSMSADRERGRAFEAEEPEPVSVAPDMTTAKFPEAAAVSSTPPIPLTEAPVFELPKTYKSSSSVPRMFGSLDGSTDSPKIEYDEEMERPRHRILGAAAAGIIAAAIVLFPASYVYNFHPRLAASIVERVKQLFPNASPAPQVEPEKSESQASEPQSATPERRTPSQTEPKQNAAMTSPSENAPSNSGKAPAPELQPEPAPVSSNTPVQPSAAPSVGGKVESPATQSKPVATFTPAASVEKSIAPREQPTAKVAAPRLPVDPNDPNELWLAVGQGDTAAEVALARLYRTGHNVQKSCEQARILLTAASKKGNADAIEELRRLLRDGCK